MENSTKIPVGVKNYRTTNVVIVLGLMIINFMLSESVPLNNTACSTDVCKKAAAEISAKMDTNVRPCDNFYRFVCGNYLKNDSSVDMNFSNRIKHNTAELLESLLQTNHLKMGVDHFRHVSALYRLCMDQKTQVEKGVEPLRQILRELGGWPLLEGASWKDTGDDWLRINSNLIRHGIYLDLFLRFGIIQSRRANKRIIVVGVPSTAHKLPGDLEEKAVKLGAEGVNIKNATAELFRFEENFVKIIIQSRGSPIEQFKFEELAERWPTINWKAFFTSVLENSSAAPIGPNDMFSTNPFFIDKFVETINETPTRILMNYALSHVVERSWIYIRDHNIIHPSSSQSKLCLDIIANHLPNSLDAMFALNYVNEVKRNELVQMVDAIRTESIETIREAEYFNKEITEKIIKKLSTLNNVIGYRDEWRSTQWLEELNNGLQVDENNFLRGILSIMRFKKIFLYRNSRSHIDDQERQLNRDRIPSYKLSENTITIAAGSSQYPLFDSRLPNYMNYGGIGFIIGHEIAHSVEHMNNDENDIFTKASPNKKECLVNQYSNYFSEQTNQTVDGYATFSENFADNVGIKLAYSTYTHSLTEHEPEPTLFNLEYTPKQMFWINWASTWCKRVEQVPNEQRGRSARYSPAEYRIIGAASNNVHFSEDFNCPVGSRMNPVNKCSILDKLVQW